ncbi:hypothetical protein BOM23_19240 [Erwinia sp. OLMDLW33]|nr:hypothetical protein BOM23_19240 [Erwinia sp. OLMDLW33]
MSNKANVQRVLLSKAQVSSLHRIREQEKTRSPYGVAPSIHVIARRLMDKALENNEENPDGTN